MANLRASENPFPSVLFRETVDPANPDAGDQRLFVDTDHLLKMRDSAGTVTTFGLGLTDPMTTRGDIIYRNSSNVTDRLGAGSSGKVLTSDGTDISWQTPSAGSGIAAGTSFPGSPSTNDLYHRTDRGLIYYYDGTRWLTVNVYRADLNSVDALQGGATALNIAGVVDNGDNGMWITRYACTTYTGGGGAIGSNYVSWQLRSRLGTGTVHNIGSTPTFATNADTQADYVTHTGAIGAAVTSGDRELAFAGTKSGSPTALYNFAAVFYRLIG